MASLGDANDGVNRIPAAIVNQDEMVFTDRPRRHEDAGARGPPARHRAHRRRLAGDVVAAHQRGGRRAGARRRRGLRGADHPVRLLQLGALPLVGGPDPGAARDPHRRRALLPRRFGRAVARRRHGARVRRPGDRAVHLGHLRPVRRARCLPRSGVGWGGPARRRRHPGVGRRGQPRRGTQGLHRRCLAPSPPASASCETGSAGLDQLSAGVAGYTGGVAALAAQLQSASAALAANPSDPVALATVQALSAQLSGVAAQGAGAQPAGHRRDRRRAVRHQPERRGRAHPREQRPRARQRRRGPRLRHRPALVGGDRARDRPQVRRRPVAGRRQHPGRGCRIRRRRAGHPRRDHRQPDRGRRSGDRHLRGSARPLDRRARDLPGDAPGVAPCARQHRRIRPRHRQHALPGRRDRRGSGRAAHAAAAPRGGRRLAAAARDPRRSRSSRPPPSRPSTTC